MRSAVPPLLQKQRQSLTWRKKCLIALALVPALIFGALIGLRLVGLFYPFFIPVGSMAPALSAGDCVAMEGITFLARSPRRGDILVFHSDRIPSSDPKTFYVKRIAGLPGDHLSISQGELFIDNKQVILSNNVGKIDYYPPLIPVSFDFQTNVIVPADCYFLLGDNSTNSFDSRFIGAIPRQQIQGRVIFRFWPPSRIGIVK